MASALYLENFLESKLAFFMYYRVYTHSFSHLYVSVCVLSTSNEFSSFLPGIETLPQDMRRNFTLMQSLDQRTEGEASNYYCL